MYILKQCLALLLRVPWDLGLCWFLLECRCRPISQLKLFRAPNSTSSVKIRSISCLGGAEEGDRTSRPSPRDLDHGECRPGSEISESRDSDYIN